MQTVQIQINALSTGRANQIVAKRTDWSMDWLKMVSKNSVHEVVFAREDQRINALIKLQRNQRLFGPIHSQRFVNHTLNQRRIISFDISDLSD